MSLVIVSDYDSRFLQPLVALINIVVVLACDIRGQLSHNYIVVNENCILLN